MSDFLVLPGVYKALFLYIEPASTILPAILIWFAPGAAWFHHELIPAPPQEQVSSLDGRTRMAIWQLGNCCYLLLGMLSSLVFRAIRDALPNNPIAQERILGASLLAMAIADATHIVASFIGLPESLKYRPGLWNPTTHGNISFVIILLLFRIAWFSGIGRTRYYFGQQRSRVQVKRI
ncbi:hypothetical protein B0F90DRAFT_1622018 [Multifurca ochricompacta]|uniref:DUF7704 domain-containing protein n=1 Tax=Multifurca ochricompacta TaxID=376703 RepID=A0AAD4QPH9_9AGAM|nr:hypothetical protein B0F90DRAFT_1622018 [Multifurca ochricompacta]